MKITLTHLALVAGAGVAYYLWRGSKKGATKAPSDALLDDNLEPAAPAEQQVFSYGTNSSRDIGTGTAIPIPIPQEEEEEVFPTINRFDTSDSEEPKPVPKVVIKDLSRLPIGWGNKVPQKKKKKKRTVSPIVSIFAKKTPGVVVPLTSKRKKSKAPARLVSLDRVSDPTPSPFTPISAKRKSTPDPIVPLLDVFGTKKTTSKILEPAIASDAGSVFASTTKSSIAAPLAPVIAPVLSKVLEPISTKTIAPIVAKTIEPVLSKTITPTVTKTTALSPISTKTLAPVTTKISAVSTKTAIKSLGNYIFVGK